MLFGTHLKTSLRSLANTYRNTVHEHKHNEQSISRNILIPSVGHDYIGMPQKQNGHPIQHVMCQTLTST